MCLHVSTCEGLSTATLKSISGFLMSLRMRLTYPRPLRPICDWLTVFVTRSGPFPSAQRSGLKALIGRKKKNWNDERKATGRSYRLMVSSKQTEKRNRVLGEKETNVERVVCCTDWKDCGVDRTFGARGLLAASAACNWLVALMPPSCVYWFKLCANTRICMQAGKHRHTHRYTQQLLSLNLTCVFIKVSSCSIVLRSNGDWLWHNYTNPCMNLVLMEAEHLTQTKCRRADQCWGAFFLSLEQQPALSKTGHLHMQCISFKIITARQEPRRLGTSQVVIPYTA